MCVAKSELVMFGSRRLCRRVRCVSAVVRQRDKVRYYNAINVTGEHSDAAKTFLLASSAVVGSSAGLWLWLVLQEGSIAVHL